MAPNPDYCSRLRRHSVNQSITDSSNDEFEGDPLYYNSYFDKNNWSTRPDRYNWQAVERKQARAKKGLATLVPDKRGPKRGKKNK